MKKMNWQKVLASLIPVGLLAVGVLGTNVQAEGANREINWVVHLYPQYTDGEVKELSPLLAEFNNGTKQTTDPKFQNATYTEMVSSTETTNFNTYVSNKFGINGTKFDHYLQAADGTYYGIIKQGMVKMTGGMFTTQGTAWQGTPVNGKLFMTGGTGPYTYEIWGVGDAIPSIDAKDLTLSVGDTFTEKEGVTATDKEEGDLTASIQVESNNVKTDTPGNYQVVYTVADSLGGSSRKVVNVTVLGKPVIQAENRTINKGDSFNALDGVSASNPDGTPIELTDADVTSEVKADEPGTYNVTYHVNSKDGVSAEKTITVTVNDYPVIDVPENITIGVGDTYNPLDNVKASDLEDGTITLSDANVVSDVDVNQPGEYTVTYTVTDSNGAQSTVQTKVIVRSRPSVDQGEVKVEKGKDFDPLKDVVFKDADGNPITLTEENIVENTVDTSKPGTYHVTYKVIDKDGVEVTTTVEVVIEDTKKSEDNSKQEENKNTGSTKAEEKTSTSKKSKGTKTSVTVGLGLFSGLAGASASAAGILSVLKKKKSKR